MVMASQHPIRMAHVFKVVIAFSCPSCGTGSILDAVIESESDDHRVVSDRVRSLPATCPTCSRIALPGTPKHVHAAMISGGVYARAGRRGHRK
jgi:ribosomal protein S27AE